MVELGVDAGVVSEVCEGTEGAVAEWGVGAVKLRFDKRGIGGDIDQEVELGTAVGSSHGNKYHFEVISSWRFRCCWFAVRLNGPATCHRTPMVWVAAHARFDNKRLVFLMGLLCRKLSLGRGPEAGHQRTRRQTPV